MQILLRSLRYRPEVGDALLTGGEAIARLMGQSKKLAAGTVLVEADETHDYVYRLRSGWMARIRSLPDGRSQIILVFLPGDLFGVKSMFVKTHGDSVLVLSDAVVQQIDYRTLWNAYNTDKDVSARCTWQVIEEERRLHNWVVGLGRGDAEERLALLLLDFKGRLTLSGTMAPEALEYVLPMTQEQMADHLGISTVHVNRVLKTFREAGMAVMKGRKVRIENLEALAKVAAPLLDTFERNAHEFVGISAGILDMRDRP